MWKIFQNKVTNEVRTVKQSNFNVLAFLFTWIYSALKSMWLQAVIIFAVNFIAVIGTVYNPTWLLVIFVIPFYCGFRFNEDYEKHLYKSGSELVKIVAAANKNHALMSWQDLNDIRQK